MLLASPVSRLVVRVLGFLPLAFAVWYFAAPVLLWPAGLLASAVADTTLGDLVLRVQQHGAVFTFVTSLRPGSAAARPDAAVTVDVNGLLYAFGLPLFAALTLAARTPRRVRILAIGYAAVTAVVAWGLLADFLKNVAITSGPAIASQTGFSAGEREVIAFAFQLGSLILPTVVPAVVWVLTHRTFVMRTIAGVPTPA